MAKHRSLVGIGQGTQWCSPPCVLPALHFGDCWDGTYCEGCPGDCRYCSGAADCACLMDHREDDV